MTTAIHPPEPRSFTSADKRCDVVLKGGVTSGIIYPLALCELAEAYQFKRLGGTSSGAIVAAFGAAAEYYRQDQWEKGYVTPAQRPPDGALRPGFHGLEDLADDIHTGDKLFAVFKPDEQTKPIFDVLFAGHMEEARGRKANEKTRATSNGGTNTRGKAPDTSDHRNRVQPMVRAFVAFWSNVPKLLPTLGAVVALAATLAVTWSTLDRVGSMLHEGWRHRIEGDALAVLMIVVLLTAFVVGGLAGGAASAMLLIRRKWLPTFVANGFGLARGLSRQPAGGAPARDVDGPEPYSLTTWMTRIINELAGRASIASPLTLGDLWRVGGGPEADPRIQFETITTCLTLARPLHLPEDLEKDLPFYFDPDEWRAYFPVRVVKYLKDHAVGSPRYRDPHADVGPLYYRLPRAADLPVVVITRLSVAFPVLLSAVPLWSVDLNTTGDSEPDTKPLRRAWFSDGGISSNFPIHFFDALIPRWPTFGIDLRDDSEAYPLSTTNERKNVWMPLTNEAGRTEWWRRFASDQQPDAPLSPAAAMTSVGQFGAAIATTLMNWRDNMLAHEAGFRDRIAHVKIDNKNEGGLNLDMPEEVIDRLFERGVAAGALLRHRYTISEEALACENAETAKTRNGYWKPTTVSWQNHRWVRFRASMAALEDALELMDTAYTEAPGYTPLVNRAENVPPLDFQWTIDQRAANPVEKTAALLFALKAWRSAPGMRFDRGALPVRLPELRMSPGV